MADKCARADGRLKFNAVVPFRSPDKAVAEIRRLAARPGMVSVLARGIEWDKPLDHPDFHPIYQEIENQGVPVAVVARRRGAAAMGLQPRLVVGHRLGARLANGVENLVASLAHRAPPRSAHCC